MSAITADEIARARKLASASRRRLVDVLEEALAGDADAFTARLARTLRLEFLTMPQLREAIPAFDLPADSSLPVTEVSVPGVHRRS